MTASDGSTQLVTPRVAADRRYAAFVIGTSLRLERLTWLDAAAYCNWLSQQEGIPASQWCYRESLEPVPDYLERGGTPDAPEGRVLRLPVRSDVDPHIADIREQLIIELSAR